jgi:hypothetical protein
MQYEKRSPISVCLAVGEFEPLNEQLYKSTGTLEPLGEENWQCEISIIQTNKNIDTYFDFLRTIDSPHSL